MNTKYVFPSKLNADEFKLIRESVGFTKEELASFCGVNWRTIHRYENGDKIADGPIVRLMYMLYLNVVEKEMFELPKQGYQTRFLYKCGELICTVIDVDDTNKRVKIKNFTKSTRLRAFGDNTEPTYDDYCSFLEERCIPKTQHLIKEYLNDLGIPFYDPYLIVLKTKGKLEGDNFSLELVVDEND